MSSDSAPPRPLETVLVMDWLHVTIPARPAAPGERYTLEPITRHVSLSRAQLRRLAALLRDLADGA